jgi:hypothetical protein
VTFGASQPYLTGPLIAPVGKVVPYGDFLLKSYFVFDAQTGYYDRNGNTISSNHNLYSVNYQGLYFFGLTPWCDFNLVLRAFYNTSSNGQSAHFGDLTVGLDIQLLGADETVYFPGIKLAIREDFPTGNAQYLCPRLHKVDQSGAGTFATQFDLVFYKAFHLYDLHWLSMTLSTEYTIPMPTSMGGFNSYGGGFGTRGTVLPGNRFQTSLSFELSLNSYLELSLDCVYTFTDTTSFYGLDGITFDGTFAKVGSPCSKQLRFAPAVGANFGPHLGLLAGCYFSAMGKNSTEFRSVMINLNYLY